MRSFFVPEDHSEELQPRQQLSSSQEKKCKRNFNFPPMEEYMERPRGVKMINAAGGDPLCTSHRRKGLYG